MRIVPAHGGWIEVVCGPMFSGKSEELIRRLTRSVIGGQRVELLRPGCDTRHADDELVSHAGRRMRARRVADPALIATLEADVIGLDEVQFFGPQVVELACRAADRGVRVICSGLDMDYLREPWPVMADLLARADFIDKLQAVCMRCGGPATTSCRLSARGEAAAGGPRIEIGATERYEARCRACHGA